MGPLAMLPHKPYSAFSDQLRPDIAELCDSLESNKSWGVGRILERWTNKQPWSTIAAHMTFKC